VQTQKEHYVGTRLEIAQAAIGGMCQAQRGDLVAVVDPRRRHARFIASDNPSPLSLELARRKAYTARTFRARRWSGSTAPTQQGECGSAAARRGDSAGRRLSINVGNAPSAASASAATNHGRRRLVARLVCAADADAADGVVADMIG